MTQLVQTRPVSSDRGAAVAAILQSDAECNPTGGEHDWHSKWAKKIHDRLASHPRVILAFWVLSFLVCGYFSTYFINKAEDRLTPPFHSRVANEHREFTRLFPEIAHEEALLLYVDSSLGKITCPATECKRKCAGDDRRIAKLFANVSHDILAEFPQVQYLSYFSVAGTSLDQIKCQFASDSGIATFALFTYNYIAMSKKETHHLINVADSSLKRYLEKTSDEVEDLKIGFTGVDVLAKAGADATEKQLFTVDLVTMPVAFFIFYYMVRSWRLLLLCIWNMMISVATSFGILSFMVKELNLKPMSIQATFAQALAVSMSIDYSLFLHRRFRDEIKNGRAVSSASLVMLSQAGHVVALSCGTFMLVFVGFLFLPSHDLNALGEVAVITLFVALSVNVTNTVAAITVFPGFFSTFTFAPATTSNGVNQPLLAASSVNQQSLPPTATGKPRFKRGAPYKGKYFSFLKKVTTFPNNLLFILFVYALAIPLAIQAFKLKHNQNAVQVTPKSVEASKIFDRLQEHFPPGLLGAFNMIVASETVSAQSREFFEFSHQVVSQVSKETKVTLDAFMSPTALNGQRIPYAQSRELRNPKSVLCKLSSDLCQLYDYVWSRSVNTNNTGMITTIRVPFNPYSREGIDFVVDARNAIDTLKAQNPEYKVLLTGNEVDFYEDMKVAFDSMPVLVTTTLFVVFFLLGVGFGSAFIPIRLSLTVFIPLAAVFGFAVLVYQDGILGWMGLGAFEQTDDGFFWFIPIVCLFQALGLVLDYDIFLVHRVMEHRESGYDIQSSVIKATWEVQSTIISAGLIMASVFGGLLLSDETAVDQFGFLMCTSVLVDTFVVQCFLIGPILSLGDRFSWWPTRMPEERLITIEDDEFTS